MAKVKEPAVVVITTEPIRHDGEDVPVGSSLGLPSPQAQALIDSAAAVPGPPEQVPPAA